MTQQAIVNLLDSKGPMTNKELMSELNLSSIKINNALMKLKRSGKVGRVDGKWALGVEHQGYNSDTKGRILSMLQKTKLHKELR